MFNEEFEFDEVTSFLTSIANFSKVRKQREINDEEERAAVRKAYYKQRKFEERPPYAESILFILFTKKKSKTLKILLSKIESSRF
jgi:hypothetical protein